MGLEKFEQSVLFIGGGAMGSAIVEGLLKDEFPAACIHVQDPAPGEKLQDLCKSHQFSLYEKAPDDLKPALIILAVKPQILPDILPSVVPFLDGNTMILSIAAGFPVKKIANQLIDAAAIIRGMPNTPAAIGKGITGVYTPANLNAGQISFVELVMGAVGETIWLETEAQIDMVTAISGSGPAYVFHMVETLTRAGIELGLPDELADQLARATISGAGALLAHSEHSAQYLRRQVTSPGGTTEAGLNILMDPKNGFEKAIIETVKAAFERAKKLSA